MERTPQADSSVSQEHEAAYPDLTPDLTSEELWSYWHREVARREERNALQVAHAFASWQLAKRGGEGAAQ